MIAALTSYLKVFPSEQERLRELQTFLHQTKDHRQLFHRKNFAGHITASGFVLSPDGKSLAVVNHFFLNRYLQPGGHVEQTDESILAAAIREIHEETNLRGFRQIPFRDDPLFPIDIDTHEIPVNPKKGEPKHYHHDFRFLFQTEAEIKPLNADWTWRPVESAIDEETYKLVVPKLKSSMLANLP